MSCCISTTKRGFEKVSLQRSLHLISPKLRGNQSSPSSELSNQENEASFIPTSAVITSVSKLEDATNARLAHDPCVGNDEANFDPVEIYVSDDAHVLRCRPLSVADDDKMLSPSPPSIFGIRESATSLALQFSTGVDERDIDVEVSLLEPNCVDLLDNNISEEERISKSFCCCQHPRGDWRRLKEENPQSQAIPVSKSEPNREELATPTYGASVKFIDLTKIQNLRRKISSNGCEFYPCFDTPGRVFHLLRSILSCDVANSVEQSSNRIMTRRTELHSVSPWRRAYQNNNNKCFEEYNVQPKANSSPDRYFTSDPVVALLVAGPFLSDVEESNRDANDLFWDDLEYEELCEILKFRTGDAAPSYYLYSSSQLTGNDIRRVHNNHNASGDENQKNIRSLDDESYLLLNLLEDLRLGQSNFEDEAGSNKSAYLLVYRRLPPRDVLTHHIPYQDVHDCLDSIHPIEPSKFVGCMWEAYFENNLVNESNKPIIPDPVLKYRLVSPPYQSYVEEYPEILDSLLKNIDLIRNEARRIPQWTAWPERNHYSSSADDSEITDREDSDSIHPASWTVFPLCHTFPANDVTQRKFIDKTCLFVPQTTELLRNIGPSLRTALFSRLKRRTTLGSHTGWADLANHVLRVHIPLVVAGGTKERACSDGNFNVGLCGTWVDGCVETHDEGRVICFDDSKVHRAFNYTDEERIVLIIDLERKRSGSLPLPIGTSSGGHTDELDAFIKELS